MLAEVAVVDIEPSDVTIRTCYGEISPRPVQVIALGKLPPAYSTGQRKTDAIA